MWTVMGFHAVVSVQASLLLNCTVVAQTSLSPPRLPVLQTSHAFLCSLQTLLFFG